MELSKDPVADVAEDNAFFPSAYSLSQYVPPRTDYAGVKHENEYTGGRWKILMIATEERYMIMDNGTMFSTGNHPVETLLPLHHIASAGFEVDIATIGGNPAKFELWAMPSDDDTVAATYKRFLPQFKEPKKLSDIIENQLGDDSDYIAVFIPGGHGALNEIPQSTEVQTVLDWALENDKFIITLCHGPGALVASALGRDKSPLEGYSLCVFPDALDKGINVDIGYIPGNMPWYVGEELSKLGMIVVNETMTGQVHCDRKLLTGDSPLASNNLGILAAEKLIEHVRFLDS